MRTTLNLDPDLLNTAKRLASLRAMALGEVISDLANKGLEAEANAHHVDARKSSQKSGFPTFNVRQGAQLIGLDDVKRDED
jgi:hypothetical protein